MENKKINKMSREQKKAYYYSRHIERQRKIDKIYTIIGGVCLLVFLCIVGWLNTIFDLDGLNTVYATETTTQKEMIPIEECIPLEDIATCYINADGYPCFELKDVGNQLDNPCNRSYDDIMEEVTSTTETTMETRTATAVLVDIDEETGDYILQTEDGHLWSISDAPEVVYSVTFDTNGTIDVTDDKIVGLE